MEEKMEKVKATENYTIFKKKSGRYGVKGTNKKWINGDEKTKILSSEGLIKVSKPAEKPAEEATEEATEATEE
tara:strand:- start:26962 stop:27180 length:219 start_codon:yes stop_codon:yes gene_type:complete